MENLTTSVYECTLPVEAHMICDLLARAGISARVDGEFLAGAGGELPLGNTIKVRVDPARAAEAREVIDEWQRLNPAEPTPKPTVRPRLKSPLWFFVGALIGGGVMLLALRTPVSTEPVDTDGDGVADEFYVYRGQVLSRIDYDRNDDHKIDARWLYDLNGKPERYESDDDFNGSFEWTSGIKKDSVVDHARDVDGDGRPELVVHFRHDVPRSDSIYSPTGKLVAKSRYENGMLASRELDKDGDGHFERRIEFDAAGDLTVSAQ
jgi:hypothetical protein